MSSRLSLSCLALVQALGLGSVLVAQSARPPSSPSDASPSAGSARSVLDGLAEALLDAQVQPRFAVLARETLARNPEIARAELLVDASQASEPQAGALPDPTASVSLFALPPETRVGPQRFSASVQQSIPGFGKRSLATQRAEQRTLATRAHVEAKRLDVLTDLRRLVVELAFLETYEGIVSNERSTLERYEQAAQARYAAGTGLQQGIVRIQAQITRVDARRLEIAERRAALRSQVNRLRDRPPSEPIDVELDLAKWDGGRIDAAAWSALARSTRPELRAVQARIDAANTGVELAQKQRRPDLGVGLAYTLVDRRDDRLGRLNPPEGDGDDVLALMGSIKLPVWRRKLDAGVDEAQARRWAAEEEKRALLADIDSTIGDLASRLPLLQEHLELLEGVLIKQASEALRSAEIAYRTGGLNAVDLLESEVVLLEVQIAAARTRTDLAKAWIDAERAVARPLLNSANPSPRGSLR